MKRYLAGLWTVALLLGAPDLGEAQCACDCDGDGRVTVAELIRTVNIALGNVPISTCAAALPPGCLACTVDISALVGCVNNALTGCPAAPMPTPTVPIVQCTPPPCPTSQVLVFPPNECARCATVTVPPSTPTSTPTQKSSPTPTECPPAPCVPGEALVVPPIGCPHCATVTPTRTPTRTPT